MQQGNGRFLQATTEKGTLLDLGTQSVTILFQVNGNIPLEFVVMKIMTLWIVVIKSACFKSVMIVCETFGRDVHWTSQSHRDSMSRLAVVRDILTLPLTTHLSSLLGRALHHQS